MKPRWLTPCLLLLASCASFAGDDAEPVLDDAADAGEPTEPSPAPVEAGSSNTVEGPSESDEDAGADSGPVPGTVDAAPPPIDELTETYGIFVSPAGSADGDGTRELPLLTIASGIAKAKETGKRVYVCKGTYKEALEMKSGVSVFGGYTCTTKWSRDEGAYTRIESPSIPAVRAKDITAPTTLSGVDVVAPNASAAVPSSIALLADNAGKLAIAESKFTAGNGFAGAPGVEPPALDPGTKVNGMSGSPTNRTKPQTAPQPNRLRGGAGGTSACGGGRGGVGAIGAYATCSCGADPRDCNASVASECRYFLKIMEDTCAAEPPEPGTSAVGSAGKDGASGPSVGALSSSGYAAANGVVGANGAPGAGGRGGEAAPLDDRACNLAMTVQFASGPGGGAGGCGGTAGTPGKGGGASIAALVWSSPGLTFDATELLAGTGGAGGKGTLGSSPTAGGQPGTPPAGAGAGQPGGDGGRPGVSGSGGGGPSLGIAYHGAIPNLVNDAHAKAGAGGAGVAAASKTFGKVTWTLPASAAGLAQDIYEAK